MTDPDALKWIYVLQRARHGNPDPPRRVERPEEEWRARLSAEQFRITRQAGTERPYSSAMCGLFESGRYACACCDTVLFDANEKFDSRSGWPSFTHPVHPDVIAYLSPTIYNWDGLATGQIKPAPRLLA